MPFYRVSRSADPASIDSHHHNTGAYLYPENPAGYGIEPHELGHNLNFTNADGNKMTAVMSGQGSQQSGGRFCSACGKHISSLSSSFCHGCGKPLAPVGAVPVVIAQAVPLDTIENSDEAYARALAEEEYYNAIAVDVEHTPGYTIYNEPQVPAPQRQTSHRALPHPPPNQGVERSSQIVTVQNLIQQQSVPAAINRTYEATIRGQPAGAQVQRQSSTRSNESSTSSSGRPWGCKQCGAQAIPAIAKFCLHCGTKKPDSVKRTFPCWSCTSPLPLKATFCMTCGERQHNPCTGCQTPVLISRKFCHGCGMPTQHSSSNSSSSSHASATAANNSPVSTQSEPFIRSSLPMAVGRRSTSLVRRDSGASQSSRGSSFSMDELVRPVVSINNPHGPDIEL